jgi:hypothetical protein
MKYFVCVAVAALTFTTANAQIGGGLLNKAKNAVTKDKKEDKPAAPAKSEPVKSEPAKTTDAPATTTKKAEPAKPKAECIPFYKEGDASYKKDDGMTNELHKKYAGKVVFSKTKIVVDKQDESTYTNTFGMSDFIYCRIYTNASIKNIPLYSGTNYDSPNSNYTGSYVTRMSVNGVELNEYLENDKNDGQYEGRTTWQCFVKAQDPDKDGRNDAFIKYMNDAAPGTYTVRVWVDPGHSGSSTKACKPAAEGEFTIIKKAGDKMSLGQKFADKKAGMINPTLEAAMLKVINEYAQSNGWKEKFTKLKITDKDWYINRNEYSGRILSRSINVYAQGNWPDGHCTGVEFSILQQYDGAKYSSNCLYNGIGKTDKIDCN